MGVHEKDPLAQLSLPPGFRFYPTDEELLVQYLCRKVAGCEFSLQIIGEIDLYKFDPWVLPGKATFGEREWYFFSPRDRKYPNGSRPNRVAGSGYWKATGTDKMIMTQGRKVGIKKALVFYVGKAPKGNKTNWIMHEYRLIEPSKKNGSSKLDEWVLCRIYKKNSANSAAKTMSSISSKENSTGGSPSSATSSRLDGVLEPLPEIDNDNLPRVSSLKTVEHQRNDNFTLQRLESGNFDWSVLAGLTQLPELGPTGLTQQQGNMNVRNDVCVPSLPRLTHMDGDTVDDEVQSGLTAQRINDRVNSGYFYDPSLNGLTQGLSDPIDPFGIRYPYQQVGYGYGYEKIANRSIYWNSQNH